MRLTHSNKIRKCHTQKKNFFKNSSNLNPGTPRNLRNRTHTHTTGSLGTLDARSQFYTKICVISTCNCVCVRLYVRRFFFSMTQQQSRRTCRRGRVKITTEHSRPWSATPNHHRDQMFRGNTPLPSANPPLLSGGWASHLGRKIDIARAFLNFKRARERLFLKREGESENIRTRSGRKLPAPCSCCLAQLIGTK